MNEVRYFCIKLTIVTHHKSLKAVVHIAEAFKVFMGEKGQTAFFTSVINAWIVEIQPTAILLKKIKWSNVDRKSSMSNVLEYFMCQPRLMFSTKGLDLLSYIPPALLQHHSCINLMRKKGIFHYECIVMSLYIIWSYLKNINMIKRVFKDCVTLYFPKSLSK